jgi:hypothetical protein
MDKYIDDSTNFTQNDIRTKIIIGAIHHTNLTNIEWYTSNANAAYGNNNSIRRAYANNNGNNYEGDPDIAGSSYISVYNDILRPGSKKNISDLTPCNNSFTEGTSNSLVYLWEVQYTSSNKIDQISLRSCYGYLGTNSTVKNSTPVTLYITKVGSIPYDELII